MVELIFPREDSIAYQYAATTLANAALREFDRLGQNAPALVILVREFQTWLSNAARLIPSVNVPRGCNPEFEEDSNHLKRYLKSRNDLIESLADACRLIPAHVLRRHVLSNLPLHAPGNNVQQITLIEWVSEATPKPSPMPPPFPHIDLLAVDAERHSLLREYAPEQMEALLRHIRTFRITLFDSTNGIKYQVDECCRKWWAEARGYRAFLISTYPEVPLRPKKYDNQDHVEARLDKLETWLETAIAALHAAADNFKAVVATLQAVPDQFLNRDQRTAEFGVGFEVILPDVFEYELFHL